MGVRIFLLDENEQTKTSLEALLKERGDVVYRAVPQSKLESLEEELSHFDPQIILCDVILKTHNGYDVCRHIKNHESLSKIPIVLLWSQYVQINERRFSECQADDKLEKPFDAGQIISIITKWTAGQSSVERNVLPTEAEGSSANSPDLEEVAELNLSESPPVPPTEEGDVSDEVTLLGKSLEELTAESSSTPEMMQGLTEDKKDPEFKVQGDDLEENTGVTFISEEETRSGVDLTSLSKIMEQEFEENTQVPSPKIKTEDEPPEVQTLKSPPSPPKDSSFDNSQIKKIVEEQCQQILEETIRNSFPKIAKEVIKEELSKLTED